MVIASLFSIPEKGKTISHILLVIIPTSTLPPKMAGYAPEVTHLTL